MEAAKRHQALVDPKTLGQLAAPRAASRQAALESLAELDPSVLSEHGPAIAARLEDKQKGVRCAALKALKRLRGDSRRSYGRSLRESETVLASKVLASSRPYPSLLVSPLNVADAEQRRRARVFQRANC